MTENNSWFVGISLNDCDNATEEQAKDVMSFIGGKVLTTRDHGTFDVELPKFLDNVMAFNGWFSITFDLGDDFYQITAEQAS